MSEPVKSLPREGKARCKQILAVCPIGRSTLWDEKWRNRVGFPHPEKISERIVVWDCAKVWAWLERTSSDRELAFRLAQKIAA